MEKKISKRLAANQNKMFQNLYSYILEDLKKEYLLNQSIFKDVVAVLNKYNTLEDFEVNYIGNILPLEDIEKINFYLHLKDYYSFAIKKMDNCSKECEECAIIYFQRFIQTYGIEAFELSFWNYILMPHSSLFFQQMNKFITSVKHF